VPVPHQQEIADMPINLTGEPRFDSRGLPEGYDPHKLYEYRLDTAIKNSSGLESFLYKIMPRSLVKSLAFAIDPTAEFKVSPGTITLANRNRYRATASVLQLRTRKRYNPKFSIAQAPNYKLVSFCWSPGFDITFSSNDLVNNSGLTTQVVLPDHVKDTTRRTRLMGSEQGTLELFKGYINSPPRETKQGTLSHETTFTSTFTNEPLCGSIGGTYNKRRFSYDYLREVHAPTGATLSLSTFNQLKTGEINYAKALCQKHAVSMLKGITPFARDYTLSRNLVELRDIPRSIAQLQQSALALRKVFLSLSHSPKTRKVIFDLKGLARNVPNEYLSFHFGWKQLYKDISDLLVLPEKMSKKINFLIQRSGKPTTLRSKRQFVSGSSGVSGFDYNGMNTEHTASTVSRIERTSEVRLVVNCIWDFPPVNSVEFKHHVYGERTGISPRITDVYNLIPWTWLVDWFTGLGNYIELIDTINHDPKVVNWGMITCKTTGRLITDFRSLSTIFSTTKIDGNPDVTTQTFEKNNHTSIYEFECQTRSDVATILDVNLTSVPSTLTAYQMSILGALLLQRIKFNR
jgi:hypothetical protein